MTSFPRRGAFTALLIIASGALTSACNITPEASALVTRLAAPAAVAAPLAAAPERDPYATIYARKGFAYRTIADHSFYSAPIVRNGQPRGNSRIWGDASHETQRASIEAIRSAARAAGMTLDQEAMVLAIARHESGFNPDAAAGTTSAHGLGQFIRATGAAYGLTDASRWDIHAQAKALVAHTMDNFEAVQRKGLGPEYVYARHHDGSFDNRYGGLDIARTHVASNVARMRDVIGE